MRPRTRAKITRIWPFALLSLFLLHRHDLAAQGITPSVASKVLIKTVRITGNIVIGTVELEPIVQSYVGKELDLSELEKLAQTITEEYQRRGYTLARAYVPEQEVINGVVEIAVLEGRVGQIDVKGNKNYST
jgi:hemolysin activation/secretion protein